VSTKPENRYLAWSQAVFQAFTDGDTEGQLAHWAENCTRTAIDPFGEHHVVKGKDAILELAEIWATVNDMRLLKNEILSVSDERGIGNANVRWTGKDGEEYACNFIYIITLDEEDKCTNYTEWNVVRSRKKVQYF